MKIFSVTSHDQVRALEIGASPFGKPMMTARMYGLDEILIDTGIKHCQREILSWLAENPALSVYLTHHHEDHSGNAAAIRQRFEIPIFGHALAAEKMAAPLSIFPYQHYMWGASTAVQVHHVPDTIETRHHLLYPIHTPGHSKDHVVYWEPNRGWLFSGDLYLSDRIRYFRSDEVLKDQIASLEKVLTLDFDRLFCAHNPQLKNGKAFLARKLDHFKSLLERVAVFWKKGMNSKQIMKAIGIKENMLIRLVCTGNVQTEFIIKSAIRLLEERSEKAIA